MGRGISRGKGIGRKIVDIENDVVAAAVAANNKHVIQNPGQDNGIYPAMKNADGSSGGFPTVYPNKWPVLPHGDLDGSRGIQIDLFRARSKCARFRLTGGPLVIFIDFTSIAPCEAYMFAVHVTQDGTGGHGITWPAFVKGNPQPDLTPDSETMFLFVAIRGFDATSQSVFLIGDGSGSGGGDASLWANFPAVSDVDVNDKDILKVKNLDFDDPLSTIEGLVNLNFFQTAQEIDSLSDQLFYQVAAAQKHHFAVAGATVFEILQSIINANKPINMQGNELFLDTTNTTSIDALTPNSMRFVTNGTVALTVDSTSIIPSRDIIFSNILSNVLKMQGKEIFLDIDNDTIIDSITDDSMRFIAGSILALTISPTAILPTVDISMISGKKITNLVNPTNPQDVATKDYADSVVGSPSSISAGDSKVEVVDGGTGVIGFTLDNDLKATMSALELLLGINLDMDNNEIQNLNKIILANGLSIENTDTENTEIKIPSTDVLKILEGADIRLQIDKDVIIDVDDNDKFIVKGDGVEVGKYDDDDGNWVFNPANDVQLSPTKDIDLTPQNDIIMNPAGDIKVFKDLDIQIGSTIDFPSASSVPVGTASDGIQVKINGEIKLIKVYDP